MSPDRHSQTLPFSTPGVDQALRAARGELEGWDDLDRLAESYARDLRGLRPELACALRDHVIRAMLPFAGRIARRYRASAEPPEDLEQVARLGLINAVDRYDPARGSFTAFAVATISGELKRHFRDKTWGVRVPRPMQELVLAVREAELALAGELDRPPTTGEVAARCGVSLADVADARRSSAGYRPVSLSLPIGETGGRLGDLFGSPDPAVELVPDRLTLRRLVAQLPARERRIVVERYYGGRSQAEIADGLGISQMHVSRLLGRTLGWLRAAMLGDQAPPWPGDFPDDGPVVAVRTRPTSTTVVVTGEVDRDNAARLRKLLLDVIRRSAPGRRVEIRLGAVPLLDAAGIAVLLTVHDAARVRGVTVTVLGLSPFMRRVAATAGLRPDQAA